MEDMYLFDPIKWEWANLTGPVKGLPPAARINHGFTTYEDGTYYSFGGLQPGGA